MPVFRLSNQPEFPPVHLAEKSGLLAIGGSLDPEWIKLAYRQGIFPWFNEGEPVLWWSPDPRMVLFPEKLSVSRSMRNVLNQQKYEVKFDTSFPAVISACAQTPRNGEHGTWITSKMKAAYTALHEQGVAHSVEVFDEQGNLAGGLYGLAIGSCFFGESMFTRQSNASKVGFITLVRWLQQNGFGLIDCQVSSPHLASLGAEEISRSAFIRLISKGTAEKGIEGKWN